MTPTDEPLGVPSPREVHRALDLALRVGDILLSSGAGAADVHATIRALLDHAGLRRADVDVTFTSLRLAYQADPEDIPVSLSRVVQARELDYDELTKTHLLVGEFLRGDLTVTDARAQVARLASHKPWVPRWAGVLASAVFGGGVALLLGGGLDVTVVAAVAAVAVTVLQTEMTLRAWPVFYVQAACGALATTIALGVTALPFEVLQGLRPSLVLTASIVLLLAGIGFLGAIQDSLSGFYLTAAARVLEAVLATAGLIAGVGAGLELAPVFGIEFANVTPGRTIAPASLALALVGGVVAAAAFAFICSAPVRALPAVALTAVLGQGVAAVIDAPGSTLPWAAALAAVAIGAVSHSVAGRVRVPPLVVVVPALVPLLPGLQIFRGMNFISEGDVEGILQLSNALATAIALAAGAILGEYLAAPLKRNARRIERRVEQRLSGPRHVGVLDHR
ncbi:threonine/serine exporter family protein [Nocardioidaceae bacterium]|nr:threonine/serine exporter family protein [Nocardioidaceae bacterium]